MRKVRVGTRASKLARVQTEMAIGLMRSKSLRLEVEVVPVSTLGDRLPPQKRAEVEGKAAFTDDLETLLARREIDVAVHSMKDLPTQLADGLTIAATPFRGDPRDALVTSNGSKLSELPAGAMVGTSSIRRKAQLRALREDLEVIDLHGNVETRLSKVGASGVAAIVIAAAGLERLGQAERIAQRFSVDEIVPAPCQGTVALEVRKDDRSLLDLMEVIDDPKVRAESSCERAFAVRLGGDCDVPAGFWAAASASRLEMVGAVLSPDGKDVVRSKGIGDFSEASQSGTRFAEELLAMGGSRILGEVIS